jgi:hypothetical protein
MPNVSAIAGLVPVKYRDGSPWNGQANLYSYLAAETAQLWVGDPVTTVASANADSFGVPAVKLATAGAAVRGVVVAIGISQSGQLQPGGPYANFDNLNTIVRPTGAQTKNYWVAVADDPNIIFEIQEGGVGAVLTATSVNRNVNFSTGTRPNSSIVVSPAFLDNNTVNTTSTLNLKILSAALRIDNTPFTALQKWWVSINNHEFSTGTTSP